MNDKKTYEFKFDDHAPSFLPEGKKWKLVWHDEFDGDSLDENKWGYRRYFWGKNRQLLLMKALNLTETVI